MPHSDQSIKQRSFFYMKKHEKRKAILKPYKTKKPKPPNNPGKTQLVTLSSSPNGAARLGGY